MMELPVFLFTVTMVHDTIGEIPDEYPLARNPVSTVQGVPSDPGVVFTIRRHCNPFKGTADELLHD
jgi:hypothetical protein